MKARTLAAAGLLVAACGPVPPSEGTGNATEGETTTSSSTTSSPTTGSPTTGGTDTSGSGTGGTTDAVECVNDGDCPYGECSDCFEGQCEYVPGCCGLLPGPDGDLELRCIGYECYADDECSIDGELCEGAPGFCAPAAAIPACELATLQLSSIALAGAPSAIATLDVDGDGALDVVAVLPNEGLVEVALGDGQGTFTHSTFPTKLEPGAQRIAWADFDGDADIDLAISRPVPTGELALLFGQDAAFGDPVQITLGAMPAEVWAGDIDGDGDADLIAHNQEGAAPLTLRLGDGLGGFADEIGGDLLNGEQFVAAAGDVDGDLALEIVTNATSSPSIRVLDFQAGTFLATDPQGFKGQIAQERLLAADLDGDADAEIVGHRFSPMIGGLIASWRDLSPFGELVLDSAVQLGAVGEFDGDGVRDVLALDADPAIARVIYMGNASCIQTIPLPAPSAPELLAAGDVDGDGKADLIAGSSSAPTVTLLRSQ